jgi:ComF family protein
LRIDYIRSIAFFEGSLREAIHALKYNKRTDTVSPLAGLLHEYLTRSDIQYDSITAVPLHSSRQRERGYNQSELLARELAVRARRPYWDDVQRVRATADQVGLDARARHSNMRAAFSANAEIFRGQQVLVIDDVCTTGATLDACAVALKAAGAKAVYGLTVARPRHASGTRQQNITNPSAQR